MPAGRAGTVKKRAISFPVSLGSLGGLRSVRRHGVRLGAPDRRPSRLCRVLSNTAPPPGSDLIGEPDAHRRCRSSARTAGWGRPPPPRPPPLGAAVSAAGGGGLHPDRGHSSFPAPGL